MMGTDLVTGSQGATGRDLTVSTTLGNYQFTRSYTSLDGYTSPALLGIRWHASSFIFVDESGTDPVIAGIGGRESEYVWDALDSKYYTFGPTSEHIIESEETIGITTYKVWKLVRPGGLHRTFYRAYTAGLGSIAATTPAELEGLPLRDYDEYGNERIYSYTIFGTSTANPAARLDEIECKRADGTLEATIEFTWQDDDAAANPGTLSRVSVYRPDGGGSTETNRVVYTYKADGDGLSDALGTEGDLVQVQRYVRLTNSTSALSTWRQLVTQYRYHGGEANETSVDVDGDGYIEIGSEHQMKMSLSEEQIEFFAQETITEDGAVSDFADALDKLLTLDDGDPWYSMAGNTVINLAEQIVSIYETTGEKRALEQWLLSSCGCSGGATQGKQLEYDYWDYASGDYKRTARITENVDDGTGSMQLHRTLYLDFADFDPSSDERLYVKSSALQSGTDTWARHQIMDSLGRITRSVSTEAVSSYTPGTSTVAPSVTISSSDGLVYAWSYAGDTWFLSESRVANGLKTNFSDYTQLAKYEYDSTRPWLRTKATHYTVAGTNITDADEMQVVEYDYGFHGSTDAIAWIETKVEAEKESENGPGGATTHYEAYSLFDSNGNRVWARSADGLLVKNTFDDTTGRVLTTTVNSNTGPSGSWGTPSLSTTGWAGTGDELKSEVELDLLGRVKSSKRNVGTSFETESYVVRELRTLSQRPNLDYYATVSFSPILTGGASGKFVGPVSISWRNAGGRTIRSSTYEPVATSGSRSDEYDLVTTANSIDAELSRSVTEHSVSGLVEKRRTWHDIANNKDAETDYTYDEIGRVLTVTDPDGTITRSTYDVLDRKIKTEIGTVATGGSADMLTVSETFYDSGGTATQGVGNGRVTLVRSHVDASTTRDTEFVYDYRGRRLKTLGPTTPHQLTEYDNFGRVTRSATVTSASPTTIDAEAANRLNLSETFYSQRGLVYKSRTAIDPTATGGALEWQEGHSWFDESGRSIASWSGGAATKTVYDALGRTETTYVTNRRGDAAPGASGNYADASAITGDVVLVQSDYSYIEDTGLTDLVTSRSRAHDALVTDTGALSGLASTKSITTFSAAYYDDAGRPIHSVAYGTNTTGFKSGGTAPTVNQSSPPTRSTAGLLMSTTVYDDHDGEVVETIAPDDTITRTVRDDMGRTIMVIENYDDAELKPNDEWDDTNKRWNVINVGGAGTDVDRVTTFTYTDGGKQKKRVAHPAGTSIQETEYIYEPQVGAGLLKSYSLLTETRYPDTTDSGKAGTDPEYTVQSFYNRLGQLTKTTDQNGTTHEYTYDAAGLMTKDEITTFGTGVDEWVDRIETTYDSAGRREYVRSKDGSAVKNAVKFVYDDRGRLEDVSQDTSGDIGGSNDFTVSYSYDDEPIGSGNRSRLDELTYPDGSAFGNSYGSAGSVNDLLSRQEAITLPGGSTKAVEYEYLGSGMMATTSYYDAGFILDRTLKHDGNRLAGEYPGYDQFGRVIRHVWADDTITTGASGYPNIPPIIELEMAYDKSSNRTRTIDARPGAKRPMRDEVYSYDGLSRLIEAERGEWGGSSLSNIKGSQEWTLDALGNWDTFKYDKNLDGAYDADNYEIDPRTHNEANEYTGSFLLYPGDSSKNLDLDNVFDDSGNMEKSETEEQGFEVVHDRVFDGWNRLVEVTVDDPAEDLARYAYNGLNWRVNAQIDTDANGSYDQERDMYYDASWRLLEERIDDNHNGLVDRVAQQLWGSRYIDDSVFRREGIPGAGTSVSWSSPTYDLTGPMFSVMARMSGTTGELLERVRYQPYGEARHSWMHDVDGDGHANSTDQALLTAASGKTIDQAGYDVDADLDRDGDVDGADSSAWGKAGNKSALVDGEISDLDAVIGWDGYVYGSNFLLGYTVRNRAYSTNQGRWLSQDPISYKGGGNTFLYGNANPYAGTDPYGLLLVAINGTSSGTGSYARQGFVRDFYDDVTDPHKFYYNGPNFFGTNASGIIQSASGDICDTLCGMEDNGVNEPIDMVGWSRGAAIVTILARQLGNEGCYCDGPDCDSTTYGVRFLGLYDPVSESPLDGYAVRREISSNVRFVSHFAKDHTVPIDSPSVHIDNQDQFHLLRILRYTLFSTNTDYRRFTDQALGAHLTHGEVGGAASPLPHEAWLGDTIMRGFAATQGVAIPSTNSHP